MWSVAVLDQGVSNWFERTYKPNVYEADLIDGDGETDYGLAKTHAAYIAMCVQGVNPALGLADIRIMNSSGYVYWSTAQAGLQRVIELLNRGYAVGAINASWGGDDGVSSEVFHDEIRTLAGRGVFTVAATGNDGTVGGLEAPSYPARWAEVIRVGSHDGRGNPTSWSQNDAGYVHLLAAGENTPEPNVNGTSFAAPKVAATVATVQAAAQVGTGTALSLNEMLDVLRQGGHGPLSSPDPANGSSRYFLHDHAGSLSYFGSIYLTRRGFRPLNYIASYADLMNAFGANAAAGLTHFLQDGAVNGRTVTFDALSYCASYADLAAAFGADGDAAVRHYIQAGRFEGRAVTFDALRYIASNPDLIAAFGSNGTAAVTHYLSTGRFEGRTVTGFDPLLYLASNGDLLATLGADRAAAERHYITLGSREGRRFAFDATAYLSANPDLRAAFGTNAAAAIQHYVQYGFREGRATSPQTAVTATSEGAVDFAGNIGTAGRIAVGTMVTGTLSNWLDSDWFRLSLTVGQTVTVRVSGRDGGGGTLIDPDLRVRNASGVILETVYSGGTGRDAQFTFAAPATGTLYLDVRSLYGYTGTYTLSVLSGRAGADAGVLAAS